VTGLPGKPQEIDGGEVERYYLEGKIKEIADYCETDIVNTYAPDWCQYQIRYLFHHYGRTYFGANEDHASLIRNHEIAT
jgi:predicted PolB exonuclease-like 3'-5' exonuclease